VDTKQLDNFRDRPAVLFDALAESFRPTQAVANLKQTV
jgi:hypothetical protein